MIPFLVSASSSLIDPHVAFEPWEAWIAVGLVLGLIGTIFSMVFLVIEPSRSTLSAFLLFVIILSLSITGLVSGSKKDDNSIGKTDTNIRNAALQKYDVKLTDEPLGEYDTGSESNYSFTKELYSATNSKGERLKVSIELTDDNTDIIVFNSGKEMSPTNK